MRSKTARGIILLVAVWLFCFAILPFILLVGTSFLGQDPEKFFTLTFSVDAYSELFGETYFDVFARSIELAAVTTFLCFLLGYPFAWLTCGLKKSHRLVVLALLMIPFWTNSLIRTYAIRSLLGTKGLINKTLMSLGIIDSPLRMMYTDAGVAVGMVYLMLPFMIMPLYANMEKIDFRLIEAARDLGASVRKTFTKVIFPLSLPGIMAGCIMVFVPTMGLFYVSSLLGGAKQLLVGNLIQQQFLAARNWPLGSALSVTLVVIMIGMFLSYALVLKRFAGKKDDEGGVL